MLVTGEVVEDIQTYPASRPRTSMEIVALAILCLAFVPLCASSFLPSLAVNSCIDVPLLSTCTSSLCLFCLHHSEKHVFQVLLLHFASFLPIFILRLLAVPLL